MLAFVLERLVSEKRGHQVHPALPLTPSQEEGEQDCLSLGERERSEGGRLFVPGATYMKQAVKARSPWTHSFSDLTA